MLTVPSKRLWTAATAAAAAMLLAGVTAAVGVQALDPGNGSVADRPDGDVQFVQGGDCDTADPDNEEYCENLPPSPDGGPGEGPPGEGGDGGCYFGSNEPIQAADPAGSPNIVLVAQGRVEVPCRMGDRFYSDGCYWGLPPQVELLPNAPNGPDEGTVFVAWQPTPPPPQGNNGQWLWGECLMTVLGELPNQDYVFYAAIYWRWFEFGDIPIVTPEMVAQDWFALVTLREPEFDTSPPAGTTGVINLPVWLAVAPDPNPEDRESWWGPIGPEEHCLGGVCITIGATVLSVDWAMGDGSTQTCTRDQHRAWESHMDETNPDAYGACHYTYTQSSRDQADGRYTITATSTWEVAWTSDVTGTSGSFEPPPTREATTSLQIDEIQVLTR